jgi:hypothetical protein
MMRKAIPAVLCFFLTACVTSKPPQDDLPNILAVIANSTQMTVQEGYALFRNQTVRSYTKQHGNQISYKDAQGNSYLWYPENKKILKGQWKIERQNVGGQDMTVICYNYGQNTYNPVTKKRGGVFRCQPIWLSVATISEKAEGDIFNLSSRDKVPFVTLKFADVAFKNIKARTDKD